MSNEIRNFAAVIDNFCATQTDTEPKMHYDYFQHTTSGDIFAARYGGRGTDGMEAVEVFGPISTRDAADNKPEDFDLTGEDAEWFNAEPFRLYAGAVVLQNAND